MIKATGPDDISYTVLKACADQLCVAVQPIFLPEPRENLGPVEDALDTAYPKGSNNYRPVALTSHLMKTLKRLIHAHLRPLLDQ